MPFTDFTPDQIAYIQKHWNRSKSSDELAAEFGIYDGRQMRKSIEALRQRGHAFPCRDKIVGHIVERRVGDKYELAVRTVDGQYLEPEDFAA